MANQVPERPGFRTQGQVPRPTLRYSNGTTPTVTPYSLSAVTSHPPSPQGQNQANAPSTNSKKAVPLFNPAELQFFKHFLKSEDADSSGNGYKPQLLSSYRFLSNSLSAVTSTLSSFVSPATSSPYSQQHGTNSIQQEYPAQTTALNGTNNLPANHVTQTSNGYGHNQNESKSTPASTTPPLVQTNSFMRPQSANHVNGYHVPSEPNGTSILHGPIIVESKPVSVSDQERDEEKKRQALKSPVNNSSLPRPPSANGVKKDRVSSDVGSPTKNSMTYIGGYTLTRSGSSPVITQQKVTQRDNHRMVEQPPCRTLSASPAKFHKPLVVPLSYIHKSLGVFKSNPVPPGVTGTAIRSPRAPTGPVEESKVPQNRLKKPTNTQAKPPITSSASNSRIVKSNQRQTPSFTPVQNTERSSPTVITYHRAQSLPIQRVKPPDANIPPETNPLLGTFLGHTKLKNLNYTPAKPYNEVMSSSSPAPSEASGDAENKQQTQPKVPTVFYHKVYRPEETLYSVPNSPQPKLTKTTPLNGCGDHKGVTENSCSFR